MSIQKKSLISTLKTTKKANVAKEDVSHGGSLTSSVKSAGTAKVTGLKANFMKGTRLSGEKAFMKGGRWMKSTRKMDN